MECITSHEFAVILSDVERVGLEAAEGDTVACDFQEAEPSRCHYSMHQKVKATSDLASGSYAAIQVLFARTRLQVHHDTKPARGRAAQREVAQQVALEDFDILKTADWEAASRYLHTLQYFGAEPPGDGLSWQQHSRRESHSPQSLEPAHCAAGLC